MTLDDFKAYTGRHSWRNAATYQAFCPHEYLVKNWFHGDDYRLFADVLRFIKENGFYCFYGNKPVNVYLAEGEFYYWSMDEDPTNDNVLNRARIDDYVFYENTFESLITFRTELRVRYRRRNEPIQPKDEVMALIEKYSVRRAKDDDAQGASE